MRYQITLINSKRKVVPAGMRLLRDSDEEAIDAARRRLRCHRNANPSKTPQYDTWLLAEIPLGGRLRKVATETVE